MTHKIFCRRCFVVVVVVAAAAAAAVCYSCCSKSLCRRIPAWLTNTYDSVNKMEMYSADICGLNNISA